MRAELTRFSRRRVSARQTQSRKLDYHLVVEGSCFDVSVDHIQLIGSSAVEPHVTCDHRQHKRDRDCTLNDVRDPRAAVNTSPRMPGLTQCFLLLRWRLLIASTPRARDRVVQSPMPAFLILYGYRQTHGADVRRCRRVACPDTDAIRGARRGPPHESRHAVPITRDRPADAVEDQPLELIRPAAAGRARQ